MHRLFALLAVIALALALGSGAGAMAAAHSGAEAHAGHSLHAGDHGTPLPSRQALDGLACKAICLGLALAPAPGEAAGPLLIRPDAPRIPPALPAHAPGAPLPPEHPPKPPA